MNKKDFSYYITKFFGDYLPNHKGASFNTISLYRDCFVLFIQFCEQTKKITTDALSFDKINRKLILEFLSWLETSRKSSIQTRNQRLAAWKSFCKFVQFEAPEFFDICVSIRNIETKKCAKTSINYLSVEAIKLLLQQPNPNKKEDLRDLAILSLLYDSGARVQELLDLQVCNLVLDNKPKVFLTGKGNKTRIVPINREVSNILKNYIFIFKLQNADNIFTNKKGEKLTKMGITYILNKYIKKASILKPEYFKIKFSPHCLRHSKAMHLLENNVNLIYIRDFLGHVSVSTTEIYAKANPEIRRKQIEKSSKCIVKESKFSKNDKDDLMKFLRECL